jgi:hypothetical protein
VEDRPERLDAEIVDAFVLKAHGDYDEVLRLLDLEPALANAARDWGGGDWETGLGAASHVGRRDIAELLIERGARLDIFAAAMLGQVEIVRAMLDSFPHLVSASGPHGIPLLAHAEQGGVRAEEVVSLLRERAPAASHA